MESFISETSYNEIIYLNDNIKDNLKNDKLFKILNSMNEIYFLSTFNKLNMNINKIKRLITIIKNIVKNLTQGEKLNHIFREEMFKLIKKCLTPINNWENNILINYFLDIVEIHFSEIFPNYFDLDLCEAILLDIKICVSENNLNYYYIYINFLNKNLNSLKNWQSIILFRFIIIYSKFSIIIFNNFLRNNDSKDFDAYLKTIYNILNNFRNKLFQDLNSYFYNIPFKYLYIFDKKFMWDKKGYKILNYEFFPINIYQILNLRVTIINNLIYYIFYLYNSNNYLFDTFGMKSKRKTKVKYSTINLNTTNKYTWKDGDHIINFLDIFININFIEDFQVMNNIDLKNTFKALARYSKFIDPNGSYSTFQNIDINNDIFKKFYSSINKLKKLFLFRSNILFNFFLDSSKNFKNNYDFKKSKFSKIFSSLNYTNEQEIFIYKLFFKDIFYFKIKKEQFWILKNINLYEFIHKLFLNYNKNNNNKILKNIKVVIKYYILLYNDTNDYKYIYELFNILDILMNNKLKKSENQYFSEIIYLYLEFIYSLESKFNIMSFLKNSNANEIIKSINITLNEELTDTIIPKQLKEKIKKDTNIIIGTLIFLIMKYLNNKSNINVKVWNSNFFTVKNDNMFFFLKSIDVKNLKSFDNKFYNNILSFLQNTYLFKMKYIFEYFKNNNIYKYHTNNKWMSLNDLIYYIILLIEKMNEILKNEINFNDNEKLFNNFIKEIYYYIRYIKDKLKLFSIDLFILKIEDKIFKMFNLINDILLPCMLVNEYNDSNYSNLINTFKTNIMNEEYKLVVFKDRLNLLYDIFEIYLVFHKIINTNSNFSFNKKEEFAIIANSIYKESYIFNPENYNIKIIKLKKISLFKNTINLRRIIFFLFEYLDFQIKNITYDNIYWIYNKLFTNDFLKKIEFIYNIIWEFEELKNYLISLFYNFNNTLIVKWSLFFIFILDNTINDNYDNTKKIFSIINLIFYASFIKNLCESNNKNWKEFFGEIKIYKNYSFLLLYQKRLSYLVQNKLILSNNFVSQPIEKLEKIEDIYLIRKLLNTYIEIINEESNRNREIVLKNQNDNFLVHLKNIFIRDLKNKEFNYLKLDLNIVNLFFYLFENKLKNDIISLNIIIFTVEELYEIWLNNIIFYYKLIRKENKILEKKKVISALIKNQNLEEFNNKNLHMFINSEENISIIPKSKYSKYKRIKKYYKRQNKKLKNKNFHYLFYIHISNRLYMLLNIFKGIDNNYEFFLKNLKFHFHRFKKLSLKNFNNTYKNDLLNFKINIPFNHQYYLFKFIKKINLKINITNQAGKNVNIYFQRTVSTYFLENQIVKEFYSSYDITNKITKQKSLLNYIKQFKIYSDYNKYFYDKIGIFYYLFKKDSFSIYKYLIWIYGVIILVFDYYSILNKDIIRRNIATAYIVDNILFFNGYLMIILSGSLLVLWLLTKYYVIVKIKIENHINRKIKNKDKYLSTLEYLKILYYDSLIKKKSFVSFATHLIYSTFYIFNIKFLIGFHIFNFIYINDTALLIISSLVANIHLLLINMFLAALIVYAFTFYYFLNELDSFKTVTINGINYNYCSNFYTCFINIFNFGFRSDIGIAKILKDVNFSTNTFNKRLISDVLFFLIINITILNIIQGIIINYFNKKRQLKDERKDDLENYCIACNLKKQYYKGKKNFKHHIKDKHNILKYYYLYEYINNLNPVDITYKENYVKKCIENNDISFFPHSQKIKNDNSKFNKIKELLK